MDTIKIIKKDESYIYIICEDDIAHEISEKFSFMSPNYKFDPRYKKRKRDGSRVWDGKIKLFNLKTRLLYYGLYTDLIDFLTENNYHYEIDQKIINKNNFNDSDAKKFISSLNLPENITIRDYQLNYFVHAIQNKKALIVSSTGSGKSLTQYLIIRYLQSIGMSKGLLVVPTTSLCNQMSSEFESYGYNSDENCHLIYDYSGMTKDSDKFLYISTWQSIYKLDDDYFSQFDFVMLDETHLAKNVSYIKFVSKCINCEYKFGLTGSLDNVAVNTLLIEGLTGKVYKEISTAELIEQNYLTDVSINCNILKYNKEDCNKLTSLMKKDKNGNVDNYNAEIDFIINHQGRIEYIRNLALSTTSNTLILFRFIDKHGQIMYDDLVKYSGDRKIFFVCGKTDNDDRNLIREIVESQSNAIIIASYGVFSTGINIKNLHNLIFAHPYKSLIKIIQSIGRILRLHSDKDIANVYDIVDDLRTSKDNNYCLDHFIKRTKIYNQEKYKYSFKQIKLD